MLKPVPVKRLRVGMYVSLKDIPWFKHPFLLTSFEIRDREDLRNIVAIGRETVLYDPTKSKTAPLDEDADISIKNIPDNFSDKSMQKLEKASELRKRRIRLQEVEKRFSLSIDKANNLMTDVMSGKVSFYEEAKDVADEMAQTFSQDVDLCVNHINTSASEHRQEFHSLNVMVLSLMLAKQVGMSHQDMMNLSFGALVHDIGLRLIPKQLCVKPKLSKMELARFREHPRFGVTILSKLPDIDKDVMKIVYQHHEHCDGTGYPKGLKCNEITELSRIVAIAELYDELINTRVPENALSPHKALAVMFGKHAKRFDTDYLQVFIKMLGVYPPGTICRFVSGDIGVILSVDPQEPLNPEVILFDPSIPKQEAIIYKLGIDLDMDIETTLRPLDLDMEEFDYLNSRSRIQYYPSGK